MIDHRFFLTINRFQSSQMEIPQLCWGGSQCLTCPGIGSSTAVKSVLAETRLRPGRRRRQRPHQRLRFGKRDSGRVGVAPPAARSMMGASLQAVARSVFGVDVVVEVDGNGDVDEIAGVRDSPAVGVQGAAMAHSHLYLPRQEQKYPTWLGWYGTKPQFP